MVQGSGLGFGASESTAQALRFLGFGRKDTWEVCGAAFRWSLPQIQIQAWIFGPFHPGCEKLTTSQKTE